MLSEAAFRRIVRSSALYDLIMTAAFATPRTYAVMADVLESIHDSTGLTGVVPGIAPDTVFFANLMGSVVIVWSLARILSPEPRLGRLDALARGLFAAWMIHAMLRGVSTILIGFLIVELGWMLVQLLPFRSEAAATPTR
jgi:hypothetical protein